MSAAEDRRTIESLEWLSRLTTDADVVLAVLWMRLGDATLDEIYADLLDAANKDNPHSPDDNKTEAARAMLHGIGQLIDLGDEFIRYDPNDRRVYLQRAAEDVVWLFLRVVSRVRCNDYDWLLFLDVRDALDNPEQAWAARHG